MIKAIQLLILMISLSAVANEKTIKIEADNVTINNKTGVSHYTGNAFVIQDKQKFTANNIYITQLNKTNSKNDYEILALGSNAVLAQYTNSAKDNIKAQAQKINYLTKKGLVILEGNAHLIKNNDSFNGEKIYYDIKKDIISIAGAKNKKVKLKIQLN